MLLTLTIILGIIVIAFIFVVKNLLNKVETYEDKIIEYEDSIVLFQKYYTDLTQAIRFSDEKLKLIDYRGTFKGDDEVGYFFEFLKELQKILNSFDYSKPKIEEITPAKEEINGTNI